MSGLDHPATTLQHGEEDRFYIISGDQFTENRKRPPTAPPVQLPLAGVPARHLVCPHSEIDRKRERLPSHTRAVEELNDGLPTSDCGLPTGSHPEVPQLIRVTARSQS